MAEFMTKNWFAVDDGILPNDKKSNLTALELFDGHLHSGQHEFLMRHTNNINYG